VAVRKGFGEVSALLKKSRNQDSQRLLEWAANAELFDSALEKSRHVALSSARAIDEFKDSIIPYLMSDDDFELKRSELFEYQKSLQSGQSLATDFLAELESVGKGLEIFIETRLNGPNLYEDVTRRIKDLKESIHTLKTSFYRFIFSSNGSKKETAKNREGPGQSERMHAVPAGLQRKVFKCQAAFIIGNKSLNEVWTMISEDLSFIDAHIQQTATEGSRNDFKRRVSRLKELYNGLQEVLENYANVLAL